MGTNLNGQITPKGVYSKIRHFPPFLWFSLPVPFHLISSSQESVSSKHTLLECALCSGSKRKDNLQTIKYKCK